MDRKRLGLIVNPVAGIGGRVGLKGSDGEQTKQKALEMGAIPQAQHRTVQALERLRAIDSLEITTYPGEMGEDAARACGLESTVVGTIASGQTTAQDTRDAAAKMLRLGVDLLLFAGGDGTARNIYEAVGEGQVVLGIPAGVKIHSAVYATGPAAAGELAALYLNGRVTGLREAEVMDIDEEAFRHGVLSARLYGYLRVPYRSSLVQSQKIASSGETDSTAAIAEDVAEKMEADCLYILGPGTTTRAIAAELGLTKTLLGVDVVLNREMIASDVNEAGLLALIEGHRARIVVTPIGGQGFIFGRGNQQISPRVIERVGRDSLIIVSAPEKLHALGTQPLRVDTGDPAVDELLSGYITIVTGYSERAVRKVVGG